MREGVTGWTRALPRPPPLGALGPAACPRVCPRAGGAAGLLTGPGQGCGDAELVRALSTPPDFRTLQVRHRVSCIYGTVGLHCWKNIGYEIKWGIIRLVSCPV